MTRASWLRRPRAGAAQPPQAPGPFRRPARTRPIAGVTPSFTQLPARPFAAVASSDRATAFVSMPREGSRGIASLTAAPPDSPGGPWSVKHIAWVDPAIQPRGLALDARARHLLIADGAGGLLIASVARLLAGEPDPILVRAQSPLAGSAQLALHPAEQHVFVSDEDSATVSVYDLGDSLATDTPSASLLGQVPVPAGPVGISLAADGRRLLVTSQMGASGVLSALDTTEAIADPAHATVRSVPAGSNPVRVACSPDGAVAWVTARGSNAALAFDTDAVSRGDTGALMAVVQVGAAPVGVAVLDGGTKVVVANSNRYGKDREAPQTLAVIDAAQALGGGRGALLGTIPAGAFPREVTALSDDRSALVTNVISQSLETVCVC